MKSTSHSYALIGGTIWGNRGAEAMTCAAIARVRERDPDATFHHFSYYPKQDAALINGQDHVDVVDGSPLILALVLFPFSLLVGLFRLFSLKWPSALLPGPARKLRDARALLDVQGISFDDGRIVFLPYKILSILPAQLMGVPVIKLSQAMGPFEQTSTRIAARILLKRCRCVFARGAATAAALERIGIAKPPADFAPDVGFSFRPGDSLSSEGGERVDALCQEMRYARTAAKPVVALAPSTVVLAKMEKMGLDYVGLLSSLVADLQRRGALVVIFPNANRRAVDKPRNNDFVVMDKLEAHLPESLKHDTDTLFVRDDINYDGILKLVENADMLLSSRFHGMVAGLAKGVPTMVIGWSHKYAEILEQFGIAEMSVDYASAVSDASGLLDRLFDNRAAIADAIANRLPAVTAAADAQFDRALAALTLSPSRSAPDTALNTRSSAM